MADLDPATLEKFQKFQAMLAASPEIVEALNSPEILALAAKAAGKRNSFLPPEPKPEPEPEYPVVGYGVSDDVSVLSEMTTPTVMTRQSVEEDEFYPEVDGAGMSSSGLGGGPRRMTLKIGVNVNEDGSLPPPPPKSKIKGGHRTRRTNRKPKTMAPLSKIAEDADSASDDTGSTDSEPTPLLSKKDNWKPKTAGNEAHPFFGSVGAGTVPRPARHNSYNTRARRTKGRGVNRNRSMPANIKLSSNGSASSGNFCEEDEETKTSSESSATRISTGSSTSTPMTNGILKPTTTTGLSSPSRKSVSRKSLGSSTGSAERGITRNRSMPLELNTSRTSAGSASSSESFNDDDDNTKSSSDGDESPSSAQEKTTPKAADGRDMFQSPGVRKSRGNSVPRMRLVPVVNKSLSSADTSQDSATRSEEKKSKPRSRSLSKYSSRNLNSSDDDSRASARSNRKKTKPRSRSLSKYSKRNLNGSDDDNSRSESFSARKFQSDEESDDIDSEDGNSKTELYDSSSSDDSRGRPSVTRRWKPPATDDSALPPAFRLSNSNHSLKSGSSHSLKAKNQRKPGSRSNVTSSSRSSSTKNINSEEEKESRSEEQYSTSSSEEDYVRQTVRKPGKTRVSDVDKNSPRPNPEQFKQNLSELTQVIQGESTRPSDFVGRPSDYVGSPFTASRKKRGSTKKKTLEPSAAREPDWLGSGKPQKRTWKAK